MENVIEMVEDLLRFATNEFDKSLKAMEDENDKLKDADLDDVMNDRDFDFHRGRATAFSQVLEHLRNKK